MFENVDALLARYPVPHDMLIVGRKGMTAAADWARKRGKLSDADESRLKRYFDALDVLIENQISAYRWSVSQVEAAHAAAKDAKAADPIPAKAAETRVKKK